MKPGKKPLPDYAKFSGIAVQMIAIIVAGTYGGLKLDQLARFRFPLFTILLSLASVFFAIYLVVSKATGSR